MKAERQLFWALVWTFENAASVEALAILFTTTQAAPILHLGKQVSTSE